MIHLLFSKNKLAFLFILSLLSCSISPVEKMKSEFKNSLKVKLLDPESLEIIRFEISDTIYYHSGKDIVNIIKNLSNNSTDSNFIKALNTTSTAEKEYTLFEFYNNFTKIDPDARLAAIFNTLELKEKVKYNSTNLQIFEVLANEIKNVKSDSILAYKVYTTYRSKNRLNKLTISEDYPIFDTNFKLTTN